MTPFLASPMAEPYIYDRILAYLPRKAKHYKILDLATGQGYIAERLKRKGYTQLFTADVDPNHFKLNKRQFHFQAVDANQPLPYPNHTFDIVISSETIEHLHNPHDFLAEVHRILKPNGTFILTTPNVTNFISRLYFLVSGRLAFHTPNDYRLSGHVAVLPDWLLKYFFAETGFQVVSQTYSSCYLPIIKKRLTRPFWLTPFFGWITIYKLTKNQ